MQNAQIWKSIEALCDEAESVIKNGEPPITIIKSIAPPASAHQGKSPTKTENILSSKPVPPKANIVNRSASQGNGADAPLSPATMTEIAAAIDLASQSASKTQIINQTPQAMSDQLRKDLMVEVNLAVRSVLANELPKMVQHAISESLHELINASANPVANDLGALEAKPELKGKNEKIASEKRGATKKNPSKKVRPKSKSYKTQDKTQ